MRCSRRSGPRSGPRKGWLAVGLAGLTLGLTGAALLGERLREPEEDTAPRTVPMSLTVGVPVELHVPTMTRLAVDDPRIAGVDALDKNRRRLLPRAVGQTTVLVWSASGSGRDYLVSVHPP